MNMDTEGGGANGNEPPMNLPRLLVAIFYNLPIKVSIGIIAVSIGLTLKLVGWL